MSAPIAVPAPPPLAGPIRRRRALLWGVLVALLVIAQSLLVWLTVSYESSRAQDEVEAVSAGVAADLKQTLSRSLQSLQALLWNDPTPAQWRADAGELLRARREILRVERRGLDHQIVEAVESPYQGPLFTRIKREDIDLDTEVACGTAVRQSGPVYSRTYFVPLDDGLGLEVVDVCMPRLRAGRVDSFMSATLALNGVLAEAAAPGVLRSHEVSIVEGDGTRLARVGLRRGAGVYVSQRLVDLPGLTLQFRVDSAAGRPQLIPNLAVALVLGLSLALGGVVALLVRDVRKRAGAERALAESLAFRKAMEDSLVTGLRARDLAGRITYVNPAFCHMVGFSAEELIGLTTPPYWPADLAPDYSARQAVRLGDTLPGSEQARRNAHEGFESIFQRRGGERFAVLIFEAPLVDGTGRQTGWMSTVLDVSDQRRIEEISRQQQERLQATARLATVGEMASLLSHELNQPLAAIASYAAGSLNLVQPGPQDAETASMLREAAERIAEQAERAGRVIKSVHDFVRRREQSHEAVRCDLLVEAVLPLVRLQARKSGTRVEVDLASPIPRALCDRTMVEQVLLNLTRNGIQAMETHDPARRELTIRVRQTHPRWVTVSVIDQGPGVPPEVAQRLFTPFFTTREEGMGLGLSLCRTVIEQHGGALDFGSVPAPGGTGAMTEFRFTLPADTAERRPPALQRDADVTRSAP